MIPHDSIHGEKVMRFQILACILCVFILVCVSGCTSNDPSESSLSVPHVNKWGIYTLNLSTQEITLIYSSDKEISGLHLNTAGDRFVFAMNIHGDDRNDSEICTVATNGDSFQQLTDDQYLDTYPTWSPDGTRVAFLRLTDQDLDIYTMNNDGSNISKLYDSGHHDADIHWIGNSLVFTQQSSIWIMNENGIMATQLTFPPHAGEWGEANLPFGDYDPFISHDGSKVLFERLEGDQSPHGNYNIFVINQDGTGETRLTSTGYSQGFAHWSHSDESIVFLIAAKGTVGHYRLYTMNADGSNVTNITPEYAPASFLCHAGVFSTDDTSIYFVGEWLTLGS